MGGRRPISRLVVLAVLAPLFACGSATNDRPAATAAGPGPIRVASFDFAESHLLAELYSQALEGHGYRVVRAYDLGPRELVLPALVGGLVDVVPEYAGTTVQFLSLGREPASADPEVTRAALVRAAAANGLVALGSSRAENANAFVVTRATAEAHGLHSLSDVAAVDDQLVFGGPPECPTRPFCLRGLADTYGLRFAEVVPLEPDSRLTGRALRDGLVDIALMFTTDAALDRRDLVELVDDRNLQPAENITPLARAEVVERLGPGFVDVVDGVSAGLTTDDLRALNGLAAEDGSGPVPVASAWLAAAPGVGRVN